jgi:hypothetical protein
VAKCKVDPGLSTVYIPACHLIAASFGLTAATTAILFQVHANDKPAPRRLVYWYLLPVVVIAFLYAGRATMLCAGVAILCADYFLQDPVFSFYTAEWDDLIWFRGLSRICNKDHLKPTVAKQSRHGIIPITIRNNSRAFVGAAVEAEAGAVTHKRVSDRWRPGHKSCRSLHQHTKAA